jgi:molybdopterin converting factor small subunit
MQSTHLEALHRVLDNTFSGPYLTTNKTKEEKTMKVKVKCFATLADADTCDYKDSIEYDVSESATVDSLVDRLNIAKEEIKIVFRNNKVVDFDTPLAEGDQLGFAPAVGAM